MSGPITANIFLDIYEDGDKPLKMTVLKTRYGALPGGVSLNFVSSNFISFGPKKERLTLADLDPRLNPEERWNTGVAVLVDEKECVEGGEHISEVSEWAAENSFGRVFPIRHHQRWANHGLQVPV